MPTVIGTTKQGSSDGLHQHIEMVCTKKGKTYTRAEVVESIDAGKDWKTEGPDGSSATIKKVRFCPAAACVVTPYITTAPDHTTENNLDNLPAC